MKYRALVVAVLLLIGSAMVFAQGHELAITAGNFVSGNSDFDHRTSSFAYGGYYAGRILHVPLAALYMELPVVGATNNAFARSSAQALRLSGTRLCLLLQG
jgi:hypothetical protein